MGELILTTFDWVPEPPRGYVRDLRVRWALEEADLPYRVESTPFRDRKAEHFAHQPFGQAPWLTDGDLSIFESGAILLHLGERSDALLPADPRGSQRRQGMAVRGPEFGRGGEPALVPIGVLGGEPRYGGLEDDGRVPQGPGSSAWSPCWRDANGSPETSPSPTSSWRTCCASSIGSTGSRTIPPVATTSRAPRRAPLLRRHMRIRWRILLAADAA